MSRERTSSFQQSFLCLYNCQNLQRRYFPARLEGALEVEFVTVGGYTKALITLVPGQFSPLDPQDMLAVRRLNGGGDWDRHKNWESSGSVLQCWCRRFPGGALSSTVALQYARIQAVRNK